MKGEGSTDPFSGSSDSRYTEVLAAVQTQKERVLLVYRAKVAVDDPTHLLKPGLPADVQVKP